MENKDFHSNDIKQNKPLGKLVRVDRSRENEKIGAEASEYRGRYEAAPERNISNPAKKLVKVTQGENVPPRQNTEIKRKKSTKKSKKAKRYEKLINISVKIISVVSALVVAFVLVLNMPILVDKENGGNISVYNYIKNMKPAAMEGELNKENVKLDLKPVEEIKEALPELNDGLDLPQLVEGQYSVLFLGFDEEEFNTDVVW